MRVWTGPGLGEVVGPAPGAAVGVRQGERSAVSSQPVAPACMDVAQLSIRGDSGRESRPSPRTSPVRAPTGDPLSVSPSLCGDGFQALSLRRGLSVPVSYGQWPRGSGALVPGAGGLISSWRVAGPPPPCPFAGVALALGAGWGASGCCEQHTGYPGSLAAASRWSHFPL